MSDFEEIPVTASGDRPVQIVKIDDESEEHNFILDEDALNDILNKDNIKDKPVCIISVAGRYMMKSALNSQWYFQVPSGKANPSSSTLCSDIWKMAPQENG